MAKTAAHKRKTTKKTPDRPRRGRPPVEDPADRVLKAYVTAGVADAVRAKADAEGVSYSVIVRQAVEAYVNG